MTKYDPKKLKYKEPYLECTVENGDPMLELCTKYMTEMYSHT